MLIRAAVKMLLAQARNKVFDRASALLIDNSDGLAADNRDISLAPQEIDIPAVLDAESPLPAAGWWPGGSARGSLRADRRIRSPGR